MEQNGTEKNSKKMTITALNHGHDSAYITLKNGIEVRSSTSPAGPSLHARIPLKGDNFLSIYVFVGATRVSIDEVCGNTSRTHCDYHIAADGSWQKTIFTSVGCAHGPMHDKNEPLRVEDLIVEYIGLKERNAAKLLEVVEFFRPFAVRN